MCVGVSQAMEGMGTKEEIVIRVITSRRHRLKGINDVFMQLCDKELTHRVEGELSGNVKKVMVGIMQGC